MTSEQHRIIAEVERRLPVVEELGTMVAANLARAARLRPAILQRAFGGELMAPEPEAATDRPDSRAGGTKRAPQGR